jgi:hypothetical protein
MPTPAPLLVGDGQDNPLSVGRKTRVVPAAIKRALWALDRGCRFPGCGRMRYVDAHHVRHWSAGGETCLDNLMLLCSKHHALLHEGGFTIEKDYRDRWFFRRPDGRAVPACGYRPADVTDEVGSADEYFGVGASAEVWCASAEARGRSAEQDRASAETRYATAEVATNDASAEAPMVREPSAEVYRSAGAFRRFRGSGSFSGAVCDLRLPI